METKSNRRLLWSIVLLSILGFVTSLYLSYRHFFPAIGNTICDISATISCTLVNSSAYSTLLGAPVALFGVVWFIFIG